MLSDIWPSAEEIAEARSVITPEMFKQRYADAMNEPRWDSIPSEPSPLYPWEEESTYIRLPTFFQDLSAEADPIQPIESAKVLLKLGRFHYNRPHFSCRFFPSGRALLVSGWLSEGLQKWTSIPLEVDEEITKS
jgi:hypothetical protein